MAQPAKVFYLASSVLTTEGIDVALHLKGDGRRRAQQIRRCIQNTLVRDVKVAAQVPPRSPVIFPASDATLQTALTTVLTRIATVLSQ